MVDSIESDEGSSIIPHSLERTWRVARSINTQDKAKEGDVHSIVVLGLSGIDVDVPVMVDAAGQKLRVPPKKGLGVKVRFAAIRGKTTPFRSTNHKFNCRTANVQTLERRDPTTA
jgi:hypothetical protein